ncbi:MAG TPA: DivIVA domain-containing protein [Propionibacteriaceae bacterium]|jgi:cell division septum initiation protein DivIVA
MTTPGSDEPFVTGAHSFPRARQGYDRPSVDRYIAELSRIVERLRRERADLAAENHRLTGVLEEVEAKYERIRTARLDERAQDILTAAEQQAAEIVAGGERTAGSLVRAAQREAEVVEERARQELAWRRRKLLAEKAVLVEQQQALRAAASSAHAPPSSAAVPPDVAPAAGRPDQEERSASDLLAAQPGPREQL